MERPIPYLHRLTLALERAFPGCRLEVHEAAFFTQSFDRARGQHNAEILLNEFAEKRQWANWQKADKVLAVVREDLFVPGLNFVFGLAGDKYAIISLARLDPRFYGQEDGELFRERMIKEAIHELGHTFGLAHCPNRRCVMSFSNSIGEVDGKTSEFCEGCRAELTHR